MSFLVDLSPQAVDALRACTPAQRQFFSQVREILSESPYGFRDVILRHIGADGRDFYTYYDGIVPLVFTYRVYPRDDAWHRDLSGYVYIARAERPWW